MVAILSRVFMNEYLRWTLEATCSVCLTETVTPLLMCVPHECSGCGAAIKIDPRKTVFHRARGTGHVEEPLRRFRWGIGVLRELPAVRRAAGR
jgi:MinD superfamily P-loop ATPase